MLDYDSPRPRELMSCAGRLCKDYLYLYNSTFQQLNDNSVTLIPTPSLMAVNTNGLTSHEVNESVMDVLEESTLNRQFVKKKSCEKT